MKTSRCARAAGMLLATLAVTWIPAADAGLVTVFRTWTWNWRYGTEATDLGMSASDRAWAIRQRLSPQQWKRVADLARGGESVSVETLSQSFVNATGQEVTESLVLAKHQDGRILSDLMRETQQADGTVVSEQYVVLQDAAGAILSAEGFRRVLKGAKVVRETPFDSATDIAGAANEAARRLAAAKPGSPPLINWVKKHPYEATGLGVGVAVGAGIGLSGGGGGGGGGGNGSGGAGGGGAGSGTWSGTYRDSHGGGPASGTFNMSVAPDGTVSGSYRGTVRYSDSTGTHPLNVSGSIRGSVSSSGALSAGGGAGSYQWTGTLRGSGSGVSGNGSWSGRGASGSWRTG